MLRNKLTIAFALLLVATMARAQGSHAPFFTQADAFFGQHVQNGRIDYQAIKANPAALNQLVAYVATQGTLEAGTPAGKALLINAYNLFVVKGIVATYPVASPQAIGAFFDRQDYNVGGKTVSLNSLEKQVLLPQTGDARLHFALVCAAVGCPEIAAAAYRPETLDTQLDARTRKAMNSPAFTQVDATSQTVRLSQLFTWYKKDFTQGGGTVLDFVNRYRTEPIPASYRIASYDYNWQLNDVTAPALGAASAPTNNGGGSNLLQFTPSQLFAKGQYEVNLFNNLYSQTAIRNADGDRISTGIRTSILTSTLQYTVGVSNNARINVGADVVYAAGAVGPASGSSHFQLLGSDVAARSSAIASIGARIKVQPFKKLPFYSIQSTFSVPVGSDLEGLSSRPTFIALNRYVWNNQFFYDFKLSDKLRLFYEFDVRYFIRRNNEVFYQPNFVDLPSVLFLNYFPNAKLNLFVMGQYAPRYGNTPGTETEAQRFGLLQWFTQVGGGFKYQVTDQLGLEVSYGNFIASRGRQGFEAGGGQVVNFGLRFISF